MNKNFSSKYLKINGCFQVISLIRNKKHGNGISSFIKKYYVKFTEYPFKIASQVPSDIFIFIINEERTKKLIAANC